MNTSARAGAVNEAMGDIRQIEARLGVTREAVEKIRDRLVELSARKELFTPEDFPAPSADDKDTSYMYRLAQDADDRFALYAQSSRGHVQTPAHNHTTWAVVVGCAGQELNKFYERAATGGVTEVGQHLVEDGTGVAMLPDDLHSIHIDGTALNFHCYGLALERLDSREYYNASEGEWKVFSHVGEIREARPDSAR